MTIDLTTAKVGTKFRTRSAGIAVFEGAVPEPDPYYRYNDFCWSLLTPRRKEKIKFCTNSAGRYWRIHEDSLDIIAEIPSPSVDLSNCKFGDLVKLRNGTYAIVLNPRNGDSDWICLGTETGNTLNVLRESGRSWNADTLDKPRDVVEIIGPHPLAPRKYEASVTISKTITGTRDNAQEFIDRQKAKWEPREGTMVCNIKEL